MTAAWVAHLADPGAVVTRTEDEERPPLGAILSAIMDGYLPGGYH